MNDSQDAEDGNSSRAGSAHAVAQCQSGDKQAFRLIADSHGERLYGIAILLIDDRRQAEDTVQEALLKAWRNIKRLRANDKLGPWLNRILLNQINMQGRRARHPEGPIDEALQLRYSGKSPEQRAIDSETSEHLWGRLQESYRKDSASRLFSVTPWATQLLKSPGRQGGIRERSVRIYHEDLRR